MSSGTGTQEVPLAHPAGRKPVVGDMRAAAVRTVGKGSLDERCQVLA